MEEAKQCGRETQMIAIVLSTSSHVNPCCNGQWCCKADEVRTETKVTRRGGLRKQKREKRSEKMKGRGVSGGMVAAVMLGGRAAEALIFNPPHCALPGLQVTLFWLWLLRNQFQTAVGRLELVLELLLELLGEWRQQVTILPPWQG